MRVYDKVEDLSKVANTKGCYDYVNDPKRIGFIYSKGKGSKNPTKVQVFGIEERE